MSEQLSELRAELSRLMVVDQARRAEIERLRATFDGDRERERERDERHAALSVEIEDAKTLLREWVRQYSDHSIIHRKTAEYLRNHDAALACHCSDYQSSGLPCPPGKCPNAPKPTGEGSS